MSNGEQKHALTNKFIDILYTSLAHCSFNAFTNLLPHVGPALHSKLCYMISNYVSLHHNTVHALAQFVEALCYKPKVAVSFPNGVTGIFFGIILRSHYGPAVDSVSNRNEYQEYFLGDEGGRCVGLTMLPPSFANELQPPATLQACNRLVQGLVYLYLYLYLYIAIQF